MKHNFSIRFQCSIKPTLDVMRVIMYDAVSNDKVVSLSEHDTNTWSIEIQSGHNNVPIAITCVLYKLQFCFQPNEYKLLQISHGLMSITNISNLLELEYDDVALELKNIPPAITLSDRYWYLNDVLDRLYTAYGIDKDLELIALAKVSKAISMYIGYSTLDTDDINLCALIKELMHQAIKTKTLTNLQPSRGVNVNSGMPFRQG